MKHGAVLHKCTDRSRDDKICLVYARLQAQTLKLLADSAHHLIHSWRIRDSHEYGKPRAPSCQQVVVAQLGIVGALDQGMLPEVHMRERVNGRGENGFY
jgi:hypothetical protein